MASSYRTGSGHGFGRLSLAGLAPTYAYVYSMMVCNAILGMPIFGGALYLCGRCGVLFATLRKYGKTGFSTGAGRVMARVTAACLMLLNVLLLVIYPISTRDGRVWLLVVLMATQFLRHLVGKRLLQPALHAHVRRLMYGGMFFLSLGIAAWVLFYQLPGNVAWRYLAGYGLMGVIEGFSLLHDWKQSSPSTPTMPPEKPIHLRQSLQSAGAFTQFEKLWGLVVLALQVTIIMMYTYLVLTAEEVLICMLIATAATLLPVRLSNWLLHRRQGSIHKRIHWLLIGLFLWLYSVSLFAGMVLQNTINLSNAYFCLGLCSTGAALSLSYLSAMEQSMEQIARFVSKEHAAAYDAMRQMTFQIASLVAEMLVLAVWTFLAFQSGHSLLQDKTQLLSSLHPWILVPVLIMLGAALLSAVKFPLSDRMMDKLKRMLHLEAEGLDNAALRQQLSGMVYASRLRPLLIHMLKAMLRPFFRATLLHADRLVQDPDNPVVLLCNHGELYGPVVAILNVPIPVRAWTISEMSLDKEEVAQYIHRFTLSRQKWLPQWLKMPLARFIGPISVWVMGQLENIPVYRNRPSRLITTFRQTVEAMQAGDNVLIFPENPDADIHNKGYVQEGIGAFYTGFAMIASAYHVKTGKLCRFVPMYADKATGIMAFGEEFRFDPDNDPAEERERIVRTAHDAMQALRAEILAMRPA